MAHRNEQCEDLRVHMMFNASEALVSSGEHMLRYFLAAVLISTLAGSAWALNETPHYVGLDPATKACAVLVTKTQGWKIMGTYESTEAAKKAMDGMKECQGQPV